MLITENQKQSESVAAIGHPPTEDADGDGCEQCSQNGQGKIREQAEGDEGDPEDLALHGF